MRASRWGVPVALAGAAALAVPGIAAAAAAHPGRAAQPGGKFVQTNLVSDLPGQGAQIVDPNLKNPWGLAMGPATPLWAADNNAGVATIYAIPPGGTTVTKAPLTVSIPGARASTGDGPSPDGQVFNPTMGFVVSSTAGSGPALFIFVSESGRITAWSPAADPITGARSRAQVEFRSKTAVFKGLALARTGHGTFLYAANFHDGTVDVFNTKFNRVHLRGGFTDPAIPAGYAPFGIQNIGGLIYVTYAKQNAQKHDDVSGPGHGFIDIYTTGGQLIKRLASRGALNSPWGLARAPQRFGRFGGDLLAGNFGDGRISVFTPFSGKFLGQLRDTHGNPISIDDLWGLRFGTRITGGTHTLLFSAGINDETDGLLGSINPAP